MFDRQGLGGVGLDKTGSHLFNRTYILWTPSTKFSTRKPVASPMKIPDEPSSHMGSISIICRSVSCRNGEVSKVIYAAEGWWLRTQLTRADILPINPQTMFLWQPVTGSPG